MIPHSAAGPTRRRILRPARWGSTWLAGTLAVTGALIAPASGGAATIEGVVRQVSQPRPAQDPLTLYPRRGLEGRTCARRRSRTTD